MAHILSKYPLTSEQRKQYGIPEPPKLISVFFKKCGHRARMFETAAQDRSEIDDYCWGCLKLNHR